MKEKTFVVWQCFLLPCNDGVGCGFPSLNREEVCHCRSESRPFVCLAKNKLQIGVGLSGEFVTCDVAEHIKAFKNRAWTRTTVTGYDLCTLWMQFDPFSLKEE